MWRKRVINDLYIITMIETNVDLIDMLVIKCAYKPKIVSTVNGRGHTTISARGM